MKILITGDVHGNFSALNNLINKEVPELIICTGDFGYWPKIPYLESIKNINVKRTKIFWIEGNHEDHWSLREVQSYVLSYRIPVEISHNIFYLSRGTVQKLSDGRTIMFMGGALSIDKDRRQLGVDWFPEETISTGDLYSLPNEQIDIIVSHTAPVEIADVLKGFHNIYDPSEEALSQLFKMYHPPLWFFSHFHKYAEGTFEQTQWTCLNQAPHQGWWMQLPKRKE
jgi:hypothetical protein